MTRRKKTDGERIAEKTARSPHEKWGMVFAVNLAEDIDRLVRRRMAEARKEIERQRLEIERLREVIRTIRARCVELDDSDAVSETLDIASAVLGDTP